MHRLGFWVVGMAVVLGVVSVPAGAAAETPDEAPAHAERAFIRESTLIGADSEVCGDMSCTLTWAYASNASTDDPTVFQSCFQQATRPHEAGGTWVFQDGCTITSDVLSDREGNAAFVGVFHSVTESCVEVGEEFTCEFLSEDEVTVSVALASTGRLKPESWVNMDSGGGCRFFGKNGERGFDSAGTINIGGAPVAATGSIVWSHDVLKATCRGD